MSELTQSQRIEFLLKTYREQTASVAEIRELFHLLNQAGSEEQLKQAVLESLQPTPVPVTPPVEESATAKHKAETRWNNIHQAIGRRRRRPVKKLVFSAAALALLVAGLIRLAPGKMAARGWLTADVAVKAGKPRPDAAPGTNKAMLTLAGGKKIWLDSARNGSLAAEGNAEIVKVGKGQLEYTAAAGQAEAVLFHSVETPRGGEYQVRLPDGTRVWLNASSSLRFPTCFTGPDRRVELSGEAYFEVAKNASHPFHVLIGKTDIKVLGTHFNVMGYANEKELRTTLLEGKVNVTSSGRTKQLFPGNEAVVPAGEKSIAVEPGNVEQAVAWKNGLFRFHETGIRAIMRQVERWYDVDVEFRTEATNQDYTGVISRSENLSSLLQTLELTGTVHFQIAGKKVIVLP